MLRPTIFGLYLLTVVSGNPVPQDNSSPSTTESASNPLVTSEASATTCYTSNGWLYISGTSIFWPTSTDYFYGPTTGASASAVTCNAQHIQYDERSISLVRLGPTSVSTGFDSYPSETGACRTSVLPEAWSDTHTGPVTTLCGDGIPRALGPRELATNYYPGTGPCVTSTVSYSVESSFYREASASPDCTLNAQDCIGVWETYTSLSSSYDAAHPTATPGDPASPIRPADCPRTTPVQDACTNCHFNVETATVFYWPVTTTGGDMCSQGGTTITAAPTGDGPNTVVYDGKTLTSPSIYLSFDQIAAWSNRRVGPGGQCGTDHTSTLIAVDPADIYSVQNHRNGKYPVIGTRSPFNFAEYNPQTVGNYTMSVIPWTAYRGGYQCPLYDPSCTMVRDDYTPWLELPPAVRQIDASWTVCDLDWQLPRATLVALGDSPTQDAQPTNTGVAGTASATPQSPLPAPTPEPTGGQ